MDRLIVGLGNPGERYASTRHNAGFQVVDRVAGRIRARFEAAPAGRGRGKVLVAHGLWGRWSLLLAKPLTYMNRSGEAVQLLREEWDGPLCHLLVVYDDLNLSPGTLRLRADGGHGGHNGMRSVIDALGSTSFPRLRVGIGRPAGGGEEAVVDWVLSPPVGGEAELLGKAYDRAALAVLCWVEEGIQGAMSRYNGPVL